MHEAKKFPRKTKSGHNSLNAIMLCKQLRMPIDLYRLLLFGRLQRLLWRRIQDTGGIDQPSVRVQLEPKARSIEVFDI